MYVHECNMMYKTNIMIYWQSFFVGSPASFFSCHVGSGAALCEDLPLSLSRSEDFLRRPAWVCPCRLGSCDHLCSLHICITSLTDGMTQSVSLKLLNYVSYKFHLCFISVSYTLHIRFRYVWHMFHALHMPSQVFFFAVFVEVVVAMKACSLPRVSAPGVQLQRWRQERNGSKAELDCPWLNLLPLEGSHWACPSSIVCFMHYMQYWFKLAGPMQGTPRSGYGFPANGQGQACKCGSLVGSWFGKHQSIC